MPILLPLFPNKLHRFNTTCLCLPFLFWVVLMWTVAIFITEPWEAEVKGKSHIKSDPQAQMTVVIL